MAEAISEGGEGALGGMAGIPGDLAAIAVCSTNIRVLRNWGTIRMKTIVCAAAVAGLLAAGSPAAAQLVEGNVTPTRPTSLQTLLLAEGYRAKLGTDSVGDPLITSATAGYDFDIMFYDCTDNADCRSIQFSGGFLKPDQGTVEDMNKWNAVNRYARAYIDDEGDAILRMDVTMNGEGIGPQVFLENLALWNSLMSDFVDYIWD
jgi:hypothetical protein